MAIRDDAPYVNEAAAVAWSVIPKVADVSDEIVLKLKDLRARSEANSALAFGTS